MKVIDRQFGRPKGPLGSIVGHLMALEHKSIHKAAIERLQLKDTDHVLEIGFGPGTAVKLAAQQAGFVAGIDPSAEMVRQAARRNRAMIRAGRVELKQGSAISLPYHDGEFSVVFEIHSFHHWEDSQKGLVETFRVLRQGGQFLMCLNSMEFGSKRSEVLQIVEKLRGVGFCKIDHQAHSFGHGGTFITAHRR